MDNRDLYNEYSDLNSSDISYDDFDEESLQEMLFFAKDEYEQWTRDMNIAKDYAYEIDRINQEQYNDIDKMRELIGKDDHKLSAILNEKESLLNQIQQENIDFLDKIDYECETKGKEHEEKIEKIYETLNRNGV